MATSSSLWTRLSLAVGSRLPVRTASAAVNPAAPSFLLLSQSRQFSGSIAHNAVVAKAKSKKELAKKKKAHKFVSQAPVKAVTKFALCDAIRYLQAFEVGYPHTSPKYELAVRMRTLRNGPVIRSMVRLPHFVRQDFRLCVICPPDSVHAEEAKAAGAVAIGEEEVFAAVRVGKIDFNRCIAHESSLTKLNQSGINIILGPKRLMPTVKRGTVVSSVRDSLNDLLGATAFVERMAVVRLSIGLIGFTPEQLRENIEAFMMRLQEEMGKLDETVAKQIHEVVLSSTHGPGVSLNGTFTSDRSLPVDQLVFSHDTNWSADHADYKHVEPEAKADGDSTSVSA